MFKHTGIIRRIDDIGRIVIPKEVRRRFHIKDGDPLEIGEDGDYIVLQKYSVIELENETIQKLLQSFVKTTSQPVILCSTTHVLRSFRVSMKTPEYLITELSEALRMTDKSCFGYEITSDSKLKVAALERICIGNSIEGALIIPQIIINNTVSDADRKCLTLCADTIAKLLN